MLSALAERAAAVVTDDFPTFFLPRMVAAAATELPVRLEAVDSNGLLPMAAAELDESALPDEAPAPHVERLALDNPFDGVVKQATRFAYAAPMLAIGRDDESLERAVAQVRNRIAFYGNYVRCLAHLQSTQAICDLA